MIDKAKALLTWRSHAITKAEKTKGALLEDLTTMSISSEQYADAIALTDLCIKKQSDAKKHIEGLTSALLTYVFSEPVKFSLDPVMDSEGKNITGLTPRISIEGASRHFSKEGGGATNLMSFAIRIACLLLKPELSPVLLLDEPNVNLDHDKQERLVEFLLDLTDKKELQIISISHGVHTLPEVYRFSKSKGKTKVKRVA